MAAKILAKAWQEKLRDSHGLFLTQDSKKILGQRAPIEPQLGHVAPRFFTVLREKDHVAVPGFYCPPLGTAPESQNPGIKALWQGVGKCPFSQRSLGCLPEKMSTI